MCDGILGVGDETVIGIEDLVCKKEEMGRKFAFLNGGNGDVKSRPSPPVVRATIIHRWM